MRGRRRAAVERETPGMGRHRRIGTGRRMGLHRVPKMVAVGITVALVSCTDFFLAPEPGDDPVSLFEQVWNEYDAYYAYFGLRGIDWDSVYQAYRPRISPGMGDQGLADVLGEMIVGLEDGHADLYTDRGVYRYTGWYDGYRENFVPGAVDGYLFRGPPATGAGAGALHAPGLSYGWLTDQIGYIRIPTFGDKSVRDGIATALQDLASTAALVLDVRDNGGGSDLNTDAVMGRFLQHRLLAEFYAYRNGPGREDFTEIQQDYIKPVGGSPYAGLLAVLTNRTFSAAEAFVLAVDALGQRRFTVVVGDTTGGGFGNPLWRELPNGWSFRVPRWKVWSWDVQQYEGVGIPPDIVAGISDADAAALRDPILEAAIAALEAQGL